MYSYLHGEFMDMVQYYPWKNLFVTMPRQYHKSCIMTVGFPIWKTINNQNIRIGLGNGNQAIGITFLDIQKKIILSPLFHALFPDICPQHSPNSPLSNWSRTSYTVTRTTTVHKEPTVTLLTEKTKTEGLHFDLIIADDLVHNDNWYSETLRNNTKRFYHNLANLKDSDRTPIIVVGTFWHPDDVYCAEILPNPEFTTFYLPLYDDEGNSTFPEKFTPEYIESQRNLVGDKMFATQYLLKPVSEERAFMSRYRFKRYWEEKDAEGNVKKRITEDGKEFTTPLAGTMAAMDTAGGGENLAAIVILQKDQEENWFVRYIKTKNRWTPSERLKQLEILDGEFQPMYFGVEHSSQMMWDGVLPEDFLHGRSDLRAKLDKLEHKNVDKGARIHAIQPLLDRGKIYFHRAISEKAIKDIQFYPEMKDDAIPDALAYAISMFVKHFIYSRKENEEVYIHGYKPIYTKLFRGAQNLRRRR